MLHTPILLPREPPLSDPNDKELGSLRSHPHSKKKAEETGSQQFLHPAENRGHRTTCCPEKQRHRGQTQGWVAKPLPVGLIYTVMDDLLAAQRGQV